MTDPEKQKYLQAARDGKIPLTGIEARLARDLGETTRLYEDKQQRFSALSNMLSTLRNELLTLGGQIIAISKALCQAEEERQKEPGKPALAVVPSGGGKEMGTLTLEELAKTLGAEKAEFVPNA